MPAAGRFRVQELASSWASGVILILSGLAVAAYGMPSGNDAPASALQTVIGHSAEAGQSADQDRRVVASLPARSAAGPSARAAESASTPVVVTVIPRPSEPTAVPPRTAAIPRDREALARELQKELRRVGCYEGELNGAWTPATRRAMKAFTEGVNATLPVAEPDAVLLIMVQGQPDRVCGKPCPPGQGTSEDGRCLPNAILAKAAKKAPSVTVALLPKGDPAPPARRGPAVASWTATVVAAAPPSPPPVAAAPAATAPIPTEGRMALAGPLETPKPTAASDPPPVAKRHVRSRHAARARPARYVSAPRRGTFARTVFRRIDSSL